MDYQPTLVHMIFLAPKQHHFYLPVDIMICIESNGLLLDSYLNFDIGAESAPYFRNRWLKLLSLLVEKTLRSLMVPYGWRRISTVCRFEYHQNLFYWNFGAESAPFVVEQWIRYLFLFLDYYSWKPSDGSRRRISTILTQQMVG